MLSISLQFPQQHFNIITNKVEDISSSEKTKGQKSAKKSGGVSAIVGGVSQLFSVLVITGTRNTQTCESSQNPLMLPIGSSQNPPTLKISVLFNNGNNIKFGYFGKFAVLGNQSDFSELFGDKSTIIAPNIITFQVSTSTTRSLYSFE